MKKTYSLMVGLLITSCVFCQVNLLIDATTKAEIKTNPLHQRDDGGSKAAVFTEDFSGGIGTWTVVDNAGGGEVWVTETSPWTASATAANGYIVFNSDLYGAGVAEDCDIISPAFSCAALSTVSLSFTHFFRAGYGAIGIVSVSNDNGATWTDVQTWDPVGSADGANEYIDVSVQLAGSATCKIKFNWTAVWAWYWFIDDIIVDQIGAACSNVTITAITSETAASCADNDGSATVIGTGGQMNYTYLWNTGSTAANITGIASGPYTVTATDANGCSGIGSITVSQNVATLMFQTTSTDATCVNNDGQIDVSVTGGQSPYSYIWSNGNTTWTITGAAAGIYAVTATDADACTGYWSTTLTLGAGLSVTVSVNDETCGDNDGKVDLIVSGGDNNYNYSWSNLNGGSSNDNSAINLTVGTYNITITDGTGCLITASGAVAGMDDPITTTITGTNQTSCGTGDATAQVVASGGIMSNYTYIWQNAANNQIVGTTTAISNLGLGYYMVSVSDGNCQSSDGNGWLVSDPGAPNITVTATDVTCKGDANGTVVVTASGVAPLSYAWASNDGTTVTALALTSGTITGLSGNLYLVTVTDGNGCGAFDGDNVDEYDQIMITVTATQLTGPAATDGSTWASAEGGDWTAAYSWLWNNGSTTSNISGLAAGTYTATVTDVNGCNAQASVTISDFVCNLLVLAFGSDVTTMGGSDGSFTTSVTGALTTVSYTWNTGATTATLAGLTAGTYSVTVSDGTCTDSDSDVIIEPTTTVTSCNLTVTMASNNVTSNGGSDGDATVTVSGAAGTVTYLWSNNAVAASINGLSAGVYSVNVVDDGVANCSTSLSVTITEPGIGIPRMTINKDFIIYPNPTNGSFAVKSSTGCIIEIRNVIGQIVLIKNAVSNVTQINLEYINKGVYFITAVHNNNRLTKRVIIK